mmetsp:Transcript_14276/g.20857  ORF Transcript_14276/g.20857 Transcript_14276/m.20857 type:complete len:219 (+) Transcript_14276:1805-2461(+)
MAEKLVTTPMVTGNAHAATQTLVAPSTVKASGPLGTRSAVSLAVAVSTRVLSIYLYRLTLVGCLASMKTGTRTRRTATPKSAPSTAKASGTKTGANATSHALLALSPSFITLPKWLSMVATLAPSTTAMKSRRDATEVSAPIHVKATGPRGRPVMLLAELVRSRDRGKSHCQSMTCFPTISTNLRTGSTAFSLAKRSTTMDHLVPPCGRPKETMLLWL